MKKRGGAKRAEKKMRGVSYLLVKFDPGEIALIVGILEAEEPYLAQSNCLHDLVEQLLPGGRLLDSKLQLGVHRRHPHVHLHEHAKIMAPSNNTDEERHLLLNGGLVNGIFFFFFFT